MPLRTPIRQQPFLFWLVAAQLFALVPMLALAIWAIDEVSQRIETEAMADLQMRVEIAADAIGREVERVRVRSQSLTSQTPAVRGDMGRVRGGATGLGRAHPSIVEAHAIDRDGQMVFSTERPDGAALPLVPLSDEAARAFATGETVISGLTPGVFGSDPLVSVVVPWRIGNELRYALQMSLAPSMLGAVLREHRWPDSWVATLIDQHKLIVARSRNEDAWQGKPVTPSLQSLLGQPRPAPVSYATTKEGVETAIALAPVPGTPWWIAAGMPRAELAAQTAAPFRRVEIGSVILGLIGLTVSIAISRYLDRQIKQAVSGQTGGVSGVTEFAAIGAQRLMLDNDLVGMVRLVNRRSVWHNPALERIFGYEPGELEKRSPRAVHVDEAAYLAFAQKSNDVIARGDRFRDQLQLRRQDGSLIWADISGVALPDGSSLWMVVDVTAMREAHERMTHLAFRDPLTQLPNRALLEDRLLQAIARAHRHGEHFSLGVIDLNGFKAVNDQFGHARGDELLRDTARRIIACLRPSDTAARLGGDEFVLLLAPMTAPADVAQIVERVRAAVHSEVRVDDRTCEVTAAIGMADYPDDATTAQGLMVLADQRMYADKARQRAALTPDRVD